MRIKRKEVDLFLTELNSFIKKNKDILTEDEIFQLILPFKTVKPSSFGPTDLVPLSTIVEFVNKPHQNKYLKGGRTRRTSNYVRRVAYRISYQLVKAVDYEEIFYKMLFQNGNKEFQKGRVILRNFYDTNGCNSLIMPVDYGEISTDKVFKGDFEILK